MPTLSPARLAANRANALKSTGPRSPHGKSRSSQNALTHGLSSSPAPSPLLPSEDPAQYNTFRSALLSDLNPQTHEELELADRIISLHWRLRRCPAIEAELAARHTESARRDHEHRQATAYRKSKNPFLPPTAVQFLASQFDHHDDKSNPLSRLHRYETGLDRTLRRCRQDYHTLQLTRQAQEQTQPDTDDTLQDTPLPIEPTHQETFPNEPTTETARDAGVPPAQPQPELPNEPTAPSDDNAAPAPSAPLRCNSSPNLQNEPKPPPHPNSTPASCLGALVVQHALAVPPDLQNEPTPPTHPPG